MTLRTYGKFAVSFVSVLQKNVKRKSPVFCTACLLAATID